MPYSREQWLQLILDGQMNPKPPEWWLHSQEVNEHRNRTTAAIIWSRNYKADRKYLIWSQADDEDFRALGYLV